MSLFVKLRQKFLEKRFSCICNAVYLEPRMTNDMFVLSDEVDSKSLPTYGIIWFGNISRCIPVNYHKLFGLKSLNI